MIKEPADLSRVFVPTQWDWNTKIFGYTISRKKDEEAKTLSNKTKYEVWKSDKTDPDNVQISVLKVAVSFEVARQAVFEDYLKHFKGKQI
jgi:hypothetical protein